MLPPGFGMGRSGQPGPAVSTGRAAEKAPTGTLGPRGKAIEPAKVSEAEKIAPVSQDDEEAAGAWIKGSFFKKGGVSDENYHKIVSAMKGLDMLRQGEKWRDIIRERWEAGGPARATVVRVLKVSGVVSPPFRPVAKHVQTFHRAHDLGVVFVRDAALLEEGALNPGPSGFLVVLRHRRGLLGL